MGSDLIIAIYEMEIFKPDPPIPPFGVHFFEKCRATSVLFLCQKKGPVSLQSLVIDWLRGEDLNL
jgi:hypothetical protein